MRTSPGSFLARLRTEIPRLIGLGMLDREQGARILEFYALEEGEQAAEIRNRKKEGMQARIPAIVIGIAVLLIGVGLVFFYAANWRWMPPTAKLIQVFGLLVAIYGASWYLLFVRQYLVPGRGLLLLGMLAYGAAIGLVAQIYHISSQPANGVLAWLLGVLALSIVMRETWGYFLAALLAYIWNAWKSGQLFDAGAPDPNYVFIVFPATLAYLFYREKSAVGLVVAAALFFVWFYQINAHWLMLLDGAATSAGEAGVTALLFAQVPLGLALVCVARQGSDSFTRVPAGILAAIGWVLVIVPFAGLSWPIDFKYGVYVVEAGALPFIIEHGVLTLIVMALLAWQARRGDDVRLPAGVLAFTALAPVLPLGEQSVLLVYTYIGLLALAGGMLYFSCAGASGASGPRRVERFVAFAFVLLTLAAKGLGLLFLAYDDERYFVAYGAGFIVFATVIFLINQFVRDLLGAEDGPAFPRWIVDSACAFAGYGMMYALSFSIPVQNSIFEAETVVLILIGLFVTVAVGLYALLWLRGAERLPLALSGVIFAAALFCLILANSQVPGLAYSIVFNLLIFLMTAVLIYYSTRISSVLLANFAIAGLVLQILTRYFDWFWNLLSGSLLFIVTGLLVLIGGFLLERQRRRLVAGIRGDEQTD